MDTDKEKYQKEIEAIRRITFISVTVATVATIVCVACLPMVYNYVQYIHSMLGHEMEFCKVSVTKTKSSFN